MLLYDRNIIDSSSEIFGDFRKCSETIVWPSDMFFENLRKVLGNLRKIIKKSSLVCFVFNFNLISHSFAALTHEILSSQTH